MKTKNLVCSTVTVLLTLIGFKLSWPVYLLVSTSNVSHFSFSVVLLKNMNEPRPRWLKPMSVGLFCIF